MRALGSAAGDRYSLHGLVIESPLALDAPTVSDPPDYLVRLAEPHDFEGAPSGRCLAELHQAGISYWCCEHPDDPDRWLIRYPGVGEFDVDRAGGSIVARPAPDGSSGVLAILLAGAVLAHLVAAEGDPMLHASAVEAGGESIAIVGPSGAGKSTLAAMLCGAGASLVTDDTLRVRLGGERIECFRGTSQLRLRPSTEELAEIDGAEIVRTVDGRLGVAPQLASAAVPLASVVVPVPSREATSLTIERLSPRNALVELLRVPRVAGWRDPDLLRMYFEACSELVDAIPVYRATVPWGPPFSPDIGVAMLRSLGMTKEARRPT
jgi:hypothetical protein